MIQHNGAMLFMKMRMLVAVQFPLPVCTSVGEQLCGLMEGKRRQMKRCFWKDQDHPSSHRTG